MNIATGNWPWERLVQFLTPKCSAGEPRKTGFVCIRQFADASAFLERTKPWLKQHEAEHNLILGLLPKLVSGEHPYGKPIYLAAVEVDGELAGCAFRTPPHKLSLTRMPPEANGPLVDDVAGVYAELPAVMGPEALAMQFAGHWGPRMGCGWTTEMRLRIHVLERVIAPESPPGGTLRLARTDDLPLVTDWVSAFYQDTETPELDSRAQAEKLVHDKALHLWDDGGPKCMAAAIGQTPRGVRIGYVYTPPGSRRRGYATAAVATLSSQMLEAGRRCCFLYTDLTNPTSNPTSNAIYARLGYEPVCEVADVVFSNPEL